MEKKNQNSVNLIMKMNNGLTLILKQNFDCNLDCSKYN